MSAQLTPTMVCTAAAIPTVWPNVAFPQHVSQAACWLPAAQTSLAQSTATSRNGKNTAEVLNRPQKSNCPLVPILQHHIATNGAMSTRPLS